MNFFCWCFHPLGRQTGGVPRPPRSSRAILLSPHHTSFFLSRESEREREREREGEQLPLTTSSSCATNFFLGDDDDDDDDDARDPDLSYPEVSMTTIATGGSKNDDGPSSSGGEKMNGPTAGSSSGDGGGSGTSVVIGGSRSKGSERRSDGGGWKYAFGSNDESVALYRMCLGLVLCVELVSRFQYLHPFYSDEG